jgi:hypothetical protein
MTELPAHRNDLTLVMKSMGHDVVQNERGSADGDVSIGEMKFRFRVELLIRQAR